MSNYKHGMKRTKLYGVWTAMLARCTNPNCVAYPDYGGRGIDVAPEWRDFRNFYADMGLPGPGETLDRIDNNKGYSKANCRWALKVQQGRNKRNNRLLTIDGETKTMAEWAEITGLKLSTIWARINKGWTDVDAVKSPLVTVRKGIKAGMPLHASFGAEKSVEFGKREGAPA